MSLLVTKIDGRQEIFDADKINQAISDACFGLEDVSAKVTQIATETELTLYNGITTTELDEAVINATIQNIKDDPDFDIIATRLLLKLVYKEVLGDYNNREELIRLHRQKFVNYINTGIEEGHLSPDLKVFNLD